MPVQYWLFLLYIPAEYFWTAESFLDSFLDGGWGSGVGSPRVKSKSSSDMSSSS